MFSFKPFLLLLALWSCLLLTDAKRRKQTLTKKTPKFGTLSERVLRREFQDFLSKKLLALTAGPSAIYATKLRRFARLFDLNGDGIVSKAEVVGETVQEANSALDKETAAEVADTVTEAWKAVFAVPEEGLRIDSDDLVKRAGKLCTSEDRKRELRIWARSVFEESDSDRSSKLSSAEYRLTFGMFHVPPTGLKVSFTGADANKNGKVEKVEFVNAVLDYFCNKSKDSPFFGP
ncbi:uncharacterized protein LOC106172903 [Lingula anatina]|uniref:Uncharacterized protein LOC106172903 n=1 Tax=Lingula anatina TaxID=7574 RepID=A0A1S3JFV4_LINAN|nr:uncharacterized protein LOC106172903 [Lingula anatina]|eukprot:XP_013409285.1 uncharacterized protein LOC106172903 [Lingula anatina]